MENDFIKKHLKTVTTEADIRTICQTLVGIAFNEPDWKEAQELFLEFLEHEDANIRGVSATCLGHLARIHRQLDKEKVVSALNKHANEPKISGQVADALDDIALFL